MKLYKCDRCGAVGTPDDFIRLDMCIRGCPDDAFSKDLCLGCMSELDAWINGKACWKMDAEQTPAPPGTFEWVLARIRQGASPETFRRSTWPKGVHLGVEDGKKLMVYAGNRVLDHVNGYEILVTEWEEIPPKEGPE